LVIGHVFNYAHTIIWGAKVPSPLNHNEDVILGRYVEMEFAKKAVEEYWNKSDKTLNLTISPESSKMIVK
jgi:hypothetical protein